MRLNEKPTRKATIVDITCDSDGEVDKFVDLKDIKHALEVHNLKDKEPYYLAFLMIGAYQDTMGDLHNLFGAVNEAQILIEVGGKIIIQSATRGDTTGEALEIYGYEQEKLLRAVKSMIQEKIEDRQMSEEEGSALVNTYAQFFKSYPYLV